MQERVRVRGRNDQIELMAASPPSKELILLQYMFTKVKIQITFQTMQRQIQSLAKKYSRAFQSTEANSVGPAKNAFEY